MVQYDPMLVSFGDLREAISEVGSKLKDGKAGAGRLVEIPTLYGGEYGPDLEFVAEQAGLSVEEAVGLHSGVDYLVYMMGFTPGFPYLGGLPERLATPRLTTPRTVIPAGSVGIAESQTGVYPLASPGGWQLIGRTPLRLFDVERDPPSLISAGDRVRFVPLGSEDEYRCLEEAVGAWASTRPPNEPARTPDTASRNPDHGTGPWALRVPAVRRAGVGGYGPACAAGG